MHSFLSSHAVTRTESVSDESNGFAGLFTALFRQTNAVHAAAAA